MISITNYATFPRTSKPYPRLPSTKPAATTPDFYLDTLFNPTWTSGPYVFILEKPAQAPVQSYKRSTGAVAPLRSSVRTNTGISAARAAAMTANLSRPLDQSKKAMPPYFPKSYATAVKSVTLSSLNNNTVVRSPSEPVDADTLRYASKPWKNINITEVDDAAFEAASKETEEVLTWPPNLSAYTSPRPTPVSVPAFDVFTGATYLTDQNIAPPDAYMESSNLSESTVEGSPTIPAPEHRGVRVPFGVLHESAREPENDVLEKVIGLERLRRKAPPALQLDCVSENEWVDDGAYVLLAGVEMHGTSSETHETSGTQASEQLSPLAAGIQVTSILPEALSVSHQPR
ncbi:hypothetical protein BV22DRAFT_1029388 [Leucogyrophana mollusca]|uniref:Uncharacterized protein n=1 Tax=Leucogyrophana mollusca TaxID=85980 RepID=A0ACB8BXG1_9AGAM|nr:hypothetical protein BV22DRAFT_1029388 [Leucogyrophana mollusca]